MPASKARRGRRKGRSVVPIDVQCLTESRRAREFIHFWLGKELRSCAAYRRVPEIVVYVRDTDGYLDLLFPMDAEMTLREMRQALDSTSRVRQALAEFQGVQPSDDDAWFMEELIREKEDGSKTCRELADELNEEIEDLLFGSLQRRDSFELLVTILTNLKVLETRSRTDHAEYIKDELQAMVTTHRRTEIRIEPDQLKEVLRDYKRTRTHVLVKRCPVLTPLVSVGDG